MAKEGSWTAETNSTNKQTKPPPQTQPSTKIVQDRSWSKGETSSGSHVCLQLTPALTSSSAGNSQGPLQKLRLLCARRNILNLLPLLQSARWYILLTSKKLYRDDLLFLPDLVINAREDSFFTRKLQWGTRLTKPQTPVQSWLHPSYHSQVDWTCWQRVFPHAPQPSTNRPCPLHILLRKGPLRANSAPHHRHPVLLPHVVKVVPWRPNRAARNQRLSNYQNKSCKSYAFSFNCLKGKCANLHSNIDIGGLGAKSLSLSSDAET